MTSVPFVKCKHCDSVFTLTPNSGTNSLNRHLPCDPTKRHVSFSTRPITAFVEKQVPDKAARQLNSTIVTGLALDLKPLGSVQQKGFRMMAQALVDFGAKFGAVDIKKKLHSRQHLRYSILPEVVKNVKVKVVEKLSKSFCKEKPCFTLDLWTDKFKQRHFLSLNIHYIDTSFKLNCILLGVEEFPSDQNRSRINVRNECRRILSSYFSDDEVSKLLENASSVTDTGLQHMLPLLI